MSVHPRSRSAQPVGEPVERVAKGPKEPRRDAFAREHLADAERQRERRFSLRRREPLERRQCGARGIRELKRRHAEARASARGADEPQRLAAQRTRQAALGSGGEATYSSARRFLRSRSLERKDAEGAVSRDERSAIDV